MVDWSKLSSNAFSQASDALTEAKQQVSKDISEKDLDPQNIDWSKVSGDVLSRASGALTEARQLVNQAASQRDINLQNVDWSKLSGNVISRASDALTDAKQLVNQAASQRDINLQNIDWSKLLGNAVSRTIVALTDVRQLLDQTVSRKYLDITNINLSKILNNILSHASSVLIIVKRLVDQMFIYCNWHDAMAVVSQQYQEKLQPFIEAIPGKLMAKLWGYFLSCVLFPCTAVNNLSIRHPYPSAGALLLISALYDRATFQTLLQLTRKTTLLCFLPVRLTIRRFGFGSRGVEKGTQNTGGDVLRDSGFAELQSYGATMPTATSTLVSLLSYTGALIILGREWGRLVRLRDWYRVVSNAVEM